jgi:hypothetical protein
LGWIAGRSSGDLTVELCRGLAARAGARRQVLCFVSWCSNSGLLAAGLLGSSIVVEGRLAVDACGKLQRRSFGYSGPRGEVWLESVNRSSSHKSRGFEFQCCSDQPTCRYKAFSVVVCLRMMWNCGFDAHTLAIVCIQQCWSSSVYGGSIVV